MSGFLAKRRLTTSSVRNKPNITTEECHKVSILLKERWRLIETVVPCKSIRICNNLCMYMYVHNKIHLKWDNNTSSLKRLTTLNPSVPKFQHVNVFVSCNETNSAREASMSLSQLSLPLLHPKANVLND